jgi:hypothetical protein
MYGFVRGKILQTRDGRQPRSSEDPYCGYENVCLDDDLAVVRAECDGVEVGLGIPTGMEVGVGTADVGSETLQVDQVLPVCKGVSVRVSGQEVTVRVQPG